MIQNGITNFVNMLDNIMVGQLGTDPISGVAIINQLMFVFNLCLFGALSGIGIFTAQFYGKGDHKGVRDTFRMQVITGIIVIALGIFAFLKFGDAMVLKFLTEFPLTSKSTNTCVFPVSIASTFNPKFFKY